MTFPAYYNKCWSDAIQKLLHPWSKVEVVPYYAGLGYFESLAPLRAGYLAWEEFTLARGGTFSPRTTWLMRSAETRAWLRAPPCGPLWQRATAIP